MVACDHYRADACGATFFHRLHHLGTSRVDHAKQPDEDQLFFDCCVSHFRGNDIYIPVSHCQHPKGQLSHPVILFTDGFTVFIGDGAYVSVYEDVRGDGQHLIEAPFHMDSKISFPHLIDGGHPFSAGIEGYFAYTGELLIKDEFIFLQPERHVHDGRLSRVTGRFMMTVGTHLQMSIGTENGCLQQHILVAVEFFCRGSIAEVNRVATAPSFYYSHPILCERPGFVGTDYRGASQGLHRRQGTHNGILLYQTLHTNGQHNGRHNLQSFRNGCHSKAHRHHQHLQPFVAIQQSHQEDQGTNGQRQISQQAAQLLQALPHGCFRSFRVLQHVGNLTYLGPHTRGNHYSPATTIGNNAGGKCHVVPVAQWDLFICELFLVLLYRYRLTSECGLLYFQVCRLNQSQVGRDDITRIEYHNIAGHQIGGNHLLHLPSTQHLRMGCTHLIQRFERRLCLQLLYGTNDCIDNQNGQDHEGFHQSLIFHHTNDCRDDRCNQQNKHHAALELLEKDGESRFLFSRFKSVGSVLCKPLCCGFDGKSRVRVSLKLLQNRFNGLAVMSVWLLFAHLLLFTFVMFIILHSVHA